MTTEDDKQKSADDARTQLRPSVSDWTLTPKGGGDAYSVRGEMSVGREGCDIILTEGHVSRKHARLLLAGDELRVEDLGSTNGTFVNDERVEAAALKPGDELRFDTVSFLVSGPAAKPAEEDNRTVLRPAAPAPSETPAKQAEKEEDAPEKKAAPRKKASKKASKKAAPAKKAGDRKEAAAPKQSGDGDKQAAAEPAEAGKKEKPEADKQVEAEKPAEPEKKAQDAKPAEAPAKEQTDAGGDTAEMDASERRAWYERETPNMTRKVASSDLRDQFAEGATQIVRGVGDVEMPSLIGTGGEWTGHVISLDKEAMTIGRSGTDILLDEPSVSTKHAQIVRDGERWKVVDLMSANGIYVNGKKTQVAYLSPGDAVRFGRLEMRFVTDSTQVPSQASPDTEEFITGSGGRSGKDNSWIYVAIGFVVIVAAAAAYLFFAG